MLKSTIKSLSVKENLSPSRRSDTICKTYTRFALNVSVIPRGIFIRKITFVSVKDGHLCVRADRRGSSADSPLDTLGAPYVAAFLKWYNPPLDLTKSARTGCGLAWSAYRSAHPYTKLYTLEKFCILSVYALNLSIDMLI